MGSEYATGDSSQRNNLTGGLNVDTDRKGKRGAKGLVKAAIDSTFEWVSETGEAMGLWRADKRHEDSRNQHISQRTRLANRIIDLRTSPSLAIFRINSGICGLFRSDLNSQGFMEIHTPKLQGGAIESGSSVFQVEYFGRPAFLAQSPQLAKQMTIGSDFQRVYEIGPVFRAENSNTHRHLTEYTGLVIELALSEHYHEALDLIDETFKHIFEGVYRRFRKELDIITTQFPHQDPVWLNQTVRIPFKEGIAMLRESE
ncbi:MAG: hypothetical protein Q9225_000077 [Loekoesia sp. 1 TL-2023]